MAAEQAAYESAERGGGTLILGQETAARALADRRSITPEEVLAGRGEEYFRRELGKMVFGQAEAVDRAAHAIASARGGLSSGNLPAGVLMFVGQSGTGKTLLAHAMGRLYSRSGRVRVFSMGDFTESHSVARLLGAPPGYVGYERGGGVVNALLQDPASVLLFDEVEKADPEVLKFLLQLLDSPRVEDAAGRSASTTSAIIVLTSNLCSEVVDRAARNGKPYEQIAREMATAIRKERRKSGQLYFRPELLNRMRDMVVFRPLGEDTLEAIAVHEIQEAVRSVRRLKSLLLVASAGSWSPLATVLTGLCRGDEKHGRAARHVLDRLLLSPLAGYAPPPGVGNEIRVEVDVEGLLVRLFDPTGCPVGAREALE